MADIEKQLPLGGDAMQSATYIDGTPIASLTLNFVPVIDELSGTGQKRIRWIKRRGYQSNIVNAATNYTFSQGYQWKGVSGSGTFPQTSGGVMVYTAEDPGVDLKLYKWDSSETTLGTFATADYQCIGIGETLIGGTANLVLTVRKTSASYDQKLLFFPNAGALTEVTDGDFPASTFIGTPSHIDGYCVVAATDGYLYNSDLNSLSLWTSTSKIAVQATPDSLVGTAKLGQYVLALGTRSIELFYNAGLSSGSPLQRVQGGVMNYGVLHQKACIEVDDQVLFVGQSSEGVGVYLLSEGSKQPRKVSSALIDAKLTRYAGEAVNTPLRGGLVDSTLDHSLNSKHIQFSGVVSAHGQRIAILGIAGYEYGYVFSLNRWIGWQLGGNQVGRYFAVGSSQLVIRGLGVTGGSCTIETENTSTASNYYLSTGIDYGNNFQAWLKTVPMTMGTNHKKFYKTLEVIADYEATTSNVSVTAYDDDGAATPSIGTIDFGVRPPANKLTRPGMSKKRQWTISNSSNYGCAIDGAILTYEVGSN